MSNIWFDGGMEAMKRMLSLTNNDRKMITPSYAGFIGNRFYNCYPIQVPHDKNVQISWVVIKSNIFPSGIRPPYLDMIALLHYPNQLLRSWKTIKFSWPIRETNNSYEMIFRINGVEIIRRRNKGILPCDEDWVNYDDNELVKHTNTVGCRAPYQNPSNKIAPCSTKDQMEKAAWFGLRTDKY